MLGHMRNTTDSTIGGLERTGELTAIDLMAVSAPALERGRRRGRDLALYLDLGDPAAA